MEGLIKSFSELEPTIDAIAKFHAASVVLQEKVNNLLSWIQSTHTVLIYRINVFAGSYLCVPVSVHHCENIMLDARYDGRLFSFIYLLS